MAIEIERKFCVVGDGWKSVPGVPYSQGYLSRAKERTVRVRIAGDAAFLTIKGTTRGATRSEFEYPIPLDDARALLALCDGPLIEKTRYTLAVQGTVWEVDEFKGDNAGLVVAEVELQSEDQPISRPPWLGREVTHDPRYFNANLSVQPYCRWSEPGAANG